MSEFAPLYLTSVVSHLYPCFYGLGDRLCTYDLHSTPIFFSLGEGVATLGLVFAALQLADPVWKITLLIKEWYWRYMVWILSSIALVAVFIASFVNQLPNIPPPFSYPIFWEQIGFVAFAFAPLSFVYAGTRVVGLFNKKRAERFYHVMLQRASTGVQKDIEVTTSIVWRNLDKITDAIKELEDTNIKTVEDNDYRRYAASLLDLLLSEKSVADYIVTYRIGFLIALIKLIKGKSLSQRSIGMGFQKLVRRLFENPDSYSYKQLDSQGLTLYAPIYEVLFGDLYFVEEFSVLGMWSSYSSGATEQILMSEDYIDVFLEALTTAIEANKFQDNPASWKIANSLYDLNNYGQRLVWQRKAYPEEITNKLMSAIETFYGMTFPRLYLEAVQNNTVSDFEKKAKKGQRYREQSLTASYADAMVEFLGHIANMNDRKMERHYTMHVLDEILPISNGTDEFENIRICFFEYLWEEIEKNVAHGWFPAILRVYIAEMYWDAPTMPEWRKKERKHLIDYLYKELKPRILKDELMANYIDKKESELLPQEMSFDRKTGKFFIEYNDKTKKEFQ
ncbi:MAG: hypothetical protein M1120_00280 [Patescibacteria group bacterium]|nr:hypothetical protein [Patescibacteria group bacterium]